MKRFFLELAGWYGMGAILLAYFLNSFSLLSVSDYRYQLLNITGAIGIVLISWMKRAYQPMVLNVIWTSIGLIALARIITSV